MENKEKDNWSNIFDAKVDRRTFLKLAGVMGATVAASQYLKPISMVRASASPDGAVYNIPGPDPVEGEAGVKIIRTTCLMCHNFDGVQAKVKEG
ncbi:MAG: twin-arginine translocation signal domain-containing protein, partial [Methanosarcinales archaeon]